MITLPIMKKLINIRRLKASILMLVVGPKSDKPIPKLARNIPFLILVVGVFGLNNSLAQNTTVADTDFKLPPLEAIILMAEEHSPLLKQQDEQIKRADQQLAVQKKQWMTGLSLSGNYSAGNQSLLVQQATGELEAFSNFNNGYRLAVGAIFSINSLLTQGSITKIAKHDKKAAIEARNISLDELKANVIAKYYAVIASQEVLKISIDVKTASQVNKKMAEKEFSEGQISVADMAKVIEATAGAALSYENAKQNFYMNVRLLEVLIGKRLL